MHLVFGAVHGPLLMQLLNSWRMGHRQLFEVCCRSEGVLFYSIRPSAGPATPLSGAAVEDDLPVQTGDEELLGQIDGVDSGEVTGWACLRGYMAKPLEVQFSVNFPGNFM